VLVEAIKPPRLVERTDERKGILTLMKPPSGFALRKAGCALILGCKSDRVLIFVNSGTGPFPEVFCDVGGPGLRGEMGSLPKSMFSCTVADVGYVSLFEEYGVIGGSW
jgi:hypothetical protein